MSDPLDEVERIRERAYELWVQDGQPEGKEHEHWERARVEIQGGEAGGDREGGDDKVVVPPTGVTFGP